MKCHKLLRSLERKRDSLEEEMERMDLLSVYKEFQIIEIRKRLMQIVDNN